MSLQLGPVSAALEADLRRFICSHGLVVWTDPHDHYSGFVQALRVAEALPYQVYSFQGSFLELLLQLDGVASGVTRPRVVVHLPGHNTTTIKKTPALEFFRAGTHYPRALRTLIDTAAAGRVPQEQIDQAKANTDLTLEAADRWLAARLATPSGGLDQQLQERSPTEILDQFIHGQGALNEHLLLDEDLRAVQDHLALRLGIPETWPGRPTASLRRGDVAFAAASWALSVEYVTDLRRPPVGANLLGVPDLPAPLRSICTELARHLRSRHPEFYQRTADETESWLQDEIAAADAESLGRIDTFRFEEAALLKASLHALESEEWSQARQWATARLNGSFWVQQSPHHRAAWRLICAGAALGQALTNAGARLDTQTLPGALARYQDAGAAVDQAHRHLEQRWRSLRHPQLPEFDTLRERLDALRLLWRTWADDWSLDFSAVCRAQGFLPPPTLQQRTLFDDVVRPMTTEPGVTALFLVDALRFEMAAELHAGLRGEAATTVHLRARFAELPTITAVGMNALAPVARGGRIKPAIRNGKIVALSSGSFQVRDPETRQRAMHHRIGGATCPLLKLAEVLDRDTTSLRRAIGRAKLVLVHSVEIDKAGEVGAGLDVFDRVLRDLRSAWHLLREAGVRRFVFTADHGFLLLDRLAVQSRQAHGRRIDPSRRHILSTVAADHTGEVRVPLADLGYDDAGGLQLMCPDTTALFDIGGRAGWFVHGGNSLQERVIPVLTLAHRANVGSDNAQYQISAEAGAGVAGMHCLRARVAVQQGSLFTSIAVVELGLRALDTAGVHVELCDTRQGATLVAGTVRAKVGSDFELFFRLSGPDETRVRVELHATTIAAASAAPPERFAVTATGPSPQTPQTPQTQTQTAAPRTDPAPPQRSWLEELPEGGIRRLFAHLEEHGTVTEPEAARLLGGSRKLRRFSRKFEQYARKAPFSIRIQTIGGLKRYSRQ